MQLNLREIVGPLSRVPEPLDLWRAEGGDKGGPVGRNWLETRAVETKVEPPRVRQLDEPFGASAADQPGDGG